MIGKRNIMLLISLLLFIAMLGGVSAFAVSSQYWEENPLKISPGECKDVEITLQNILGNKDIMVDASISEGTDVASLVGDTRYTVPLGTNDFKVHLKVCVPGGDKIGGERKVSLSFDEVSPSLAPGGVALGRGYNVNFGVLTVASDALGLSEGSRLRTGMLWLIGLGILTAIIIIVIVFKLKDN